VLLHDTELYYPVLPERSAYADSHPNNFESSLDDYEECLDEAVAGAAEFKPEFNTVLSLHLSCRQIYQESVGSFYGKNVFMITRATHQLDLSEKPWRSHPDYLQSNSLQYAGEWIRSLGSHLNHLTKVMIDTGSLCVSIFGHSRYQYDLLPLALLLWIHTSLARALEISRTGGISVAV
jgi:hypothetical protein